MYHSIASVVVSPREHKISMTNFDIFEYEMPTAREEIPHGLLARKLELVQ